MAAHAEEQPPPPVRYEIDAGDRLSAVRDAWSAFARANDAPHLAEGVLGRSIWEFVGDDTTRDVYRRLIGRVRAGRVVTFSYRCDAPGLRRFLRMTMRPQLHDAVEFNSVTLKTEPRPALRLPAAGGAPAGSWLRICSWCSRIAVEGEWIEAEDAVDRLRLFDTAVAPAITHGMCAECVDRVLGEDRLATVYSS